MFLWLTDSPQFKQPDSLQSVHLYLNHYSSVLIESVAALKDFKCRSVIYNVTNSITFKIGAINTDSPVSMNTTTPVTLCSLQKEKEVKNYITKHAHYILPTVIVITSYIFSKIKNNICKELKLVDVSVSFKTRVCWFSLQLTHQEALEDVAKQRPKQNKINL